MIDIRTHGGEINFKYIDLLVIILNLKHLVSQKPVCRMETTSETSGFIKGYLN